MDDVTSLPGVKPYARWARPQARAYWGTHVAVRVRADRYDHSADEELRAIPGARPLPRPDMAQEWMAVPVGCVEELRVLTERYPNRWLIRSL